VPKATFFNRFLWNLQESLILAWNELFCFSEKMKNKKVFFSGSFVPSRTVQKLPPGHFLPSRNVHFIPVAVCPAVFHNLPKTKWEGGVLRKMRHILLQYSLRRVCVYIIYSMYSVYCTVNHVYKLLIRRKRISYRLL
jgi:hypothetical protein